MPTSTTSVSTPGWSPDLTVFDPGDVLPEALILRCSTVAGSVEGDAVATRVPWVDDADAEIVAEGAPISEADPGLAETVVFTAKISQLVRLSRELWTQDNAPELLAGSVARALTVAGNTMFVQQAAPVPPAVTPPAGIINTPGVLDTFTPILDDLDPLSDALAEIEGNRGTPTHILASPDAFSYLRKLKLGTGYNATLLGAGTADVDRRLLGIELIVDSSVPTGTMLVLDKSAIVSAVGTVNIGSSEHAYFANDSIGVRATWRIGASVKRPDRLAFLQVGSGS